RIYERPSDGSGEDRLVYESSRDVWPSDVSADGRWLGFIEGLFASRTSTDLYVLPLAGAKTPLPVVTGPAVEIDLAFSPAGRCVAYASDDSGRFEVYIRPFGPGAAAGAPAGGRWQVSTSGGTLPRWRRDGRELYYRKEDLTTVVALPVEQRGGSLATGRES